MASGARALFDSTLPPGPRPQIWEPYSIVGLTTAVYSKRVSLKEAGSYIVEFDVPAYPGLYPSFLVFVLNPGSKD